MDMSKEEARYSNRQIERVQDELRATFEAQLEKQSDMLKQHITLTVEAATAPILRQTTVTNGRVTKLEEISDINTDTVKEIRLYAKISRWFLGAVWTLALAAVAIILK